MNFPQDSLRQRHPQAARCDSEITILAQNSSSIEAIGETVAAFGSVQMRLAAVATGGNEMEIVRALVAVESYGYGIREIPRFYL
jgi:hypothetical protein